MSEVKFNCLHCGQKLQCHRRAMGTQIACPACGRSVVVPFAFAGGAELVEEFEPEAAPAELPNIAIPQLSLPEVEAAVRPTQKLRLAGRVDKPAPFASLTWPAFIFSLFGPFGALPAIICGHLAQAELRKRPHLRGQALTLTALILGYVFAVVAGVWLAIWARRPTTAAEKSGDEVQQTKTNTVHYHR